MGFELKTSLKKHLNKSREAPGSAKRCYIELIAEANPFLLKSEGMNPAGRECTGDLGSISHERWSATAGQRSSQLNVIQIALFCS